jgi:segregation and condensation protein B
MEAMELKEPGEMIEPSEPETAEAVKAEELPAAANEAAPEPQAGEQAVPAEEAPASTEAAPESPACEQTVAAEELLPAIEAAPDSQSTEEARLKALLEAVVYVAEEPLTLEQIANGTGQPRELVEKILARLVAEFDKPEHGVTIQVVAGGYKMATKAEHHESVRSFVKSLKPPLKLSLPALETLAVVAYKQPVTAPEIMEIRGVQGAGVLKTLLDRKLIAVAGRKNVIGKPILYKTTKDFLIQFGLKDLSELPSLKEFEEIRRLAVSDGEMMLPLEPIEEPAAKTAAGEAPSREAATASEPAAEASGEPEASASAEPPEGSEPSPEAEQSAQAGSQEG